jgi:hypothetical protein
MLNEQVPTPDLPVIAGMDVNIFQGYRYIGWATDAGFDEDFHLEPINTLGFHGPRGHKSTNYSASVNISAFVLSSNEIDKLSVPTRRTILTSGLINFQFVEKESGKLLFELRGCKCATHSVNVDQSLSRKTTRWEATEVIPYYSF